MSSATGTGNVLWMCSEIFPQWILWAV